MRIHQFSATLPPELIGKLEIFESQFEYPLGAEASFRILHGADYSLFFRSIGRATCFVAETEGRLTGVLTTVARPLWLPSGDEQTIIYVCDLKVAPFARGGRTLFRLIRMAQACPSTPSFLVFGIVMDGTSTVPTRYTGRAGIPLFGSISAVTILRFSSVATTGTTPPVCAVSRQEVLDCFRRLSKGRYATPCGQPEARSQHPPAWLMLPDGTACGLLEDTLKAKRLVRPDGTEIISAHLSCFAFRTVDSGVRLIESALVLCRERGLPAMFVAVTRENAVKILDSFDHSGITVASATLYGNGLKPGVAWNINTSEI